MQSAQTYLEIVRSRGERRLQLRRVYRNLQNKELFLRAYAKLYANKGALTPGSDPRDTVDDMSLQRIDNLIAALASGRYRWKPSRRTYQPKKDGTFRPISVPSWNDKLLQEVIRTVLSAYYEPQFSDISHGFRSGRGCHTALQSILFNWKGAKWFIEGDIKGCFDNIDHNKLLEIIGRNIKDERFLKLLRGMLQAGYWEDWRYHATYSGTPQGGVVSPILANIFLNELDAYIEQELIPQYTRGKRRRGNPQYARIQKERRKAEMQGDIGRYKALVQKRRLVSVGAPHDPEYRRLRHVRYADDFLLGFVGPRCEAEEIKQKVRAFLSTIGLTLSEAKTLITNATTECARFLGYDVHMARCNDQLWGQGRSKRRSINGTPILNVPLDVVRRWTRRRTRKGKPYHRAELINSSDYDIVTIYNLEFQGLANYYVMAHDVAQRLYPVKYVYLQSLAKTLATKHQRSVGWVYRNHYRKQSTGIKAIVVEEPREGREPLVAKFGAHPFDSTRWPS